MANSKGQLQVCSTEPYSGQSSLMAGSVTAYNANAKSSGITSPRAASLNRASTMATGSISPATRACLAMASSFLAGVSSPDYAACGSVYLLLLPAKLVPRPLGLVTSLPTLLEHPVTLGLSLSARREANVNVCRIGRDVVYLVNRTGAGDRRCGLGLAGFTLSARTRSQMLDVFLILIPNEYRVFSNQSIYSAALCLFNSMVVHKDGTPDTCLVMSGSSSASHTRFQISSQYQLGT